MRIRRRRLILGLLSTAANRANILLVAVDDLRSKLGSSGARHIRSPYFRRLATNDTGSDSVYSLSQLCGPSRTSLVPDCGPTP